MLITKCCTQLQRPPPIASPPLPGVNREEPILLQAVFRRTVGYVALKLQYSAKTRHSGRRRRKSWQR